MKIMLTLFFMYVFSSLIFTQEIKNVIFEPKGEEVWIYYDLLGEDDDYEITIFLRRENIQIYKIALTNITGDVGDVKPGTNKKIIWKIDKQYPAGLDGEDFYFVIEANEKGKTWYYYVGGAVVAGVAAILTLSGKSDESKPEVKFADPPTRP